MAYLALARKWRPKAFSEVVGQQHVVQALSNALDSGRVHHAFLFTGTRGVGKTTLARIFAKSLNCEQGTSAEPCQQCVTCQSIDEGRFVDLIEVDAASRTKVDDTRELLENVQYAPTSGKFKVYLIDEVHMLSGHSFNALLKTLEEPPEHVKFLFATTDPQKLPVTVLSRCLQFNLRAMRPEQVENQLVKILGQEKIEYDSPALHAISKAADGSMRDGLSLLDQAIAQGGGEVRIADVQSMLGTIKTKHTESIVSALLSHDVDQALSVVADMADEAVDFTVAIDEVLMQLYYVSLAQVSPSSVEVADVDAAKVNDWAKKASPEALQLFYQIGLISKRDISLAPSLRVGFEMALLRMFAFEPGDLEPSAVPPSGAVSQLTEKKTAEKKTIENAGLDTSLDGENTDQAPSAPVAQPFPDVQAGSHPDSQVAPQTTVPSPMESAIATKGVTESQSELPEANMPAEAAAPHADVPPWQEAPSEFMPEFTSEAAQEAPIKAETTQVIEQNVPSRAQPVSSLKPDVPEQYAQQAATIQTNEIQSNEAQPHDTQPNAAQPSAVQPNTAQPNSQALSLVAVTLAGNNEWGELVEQTSLVGMAKELAMNCAAERINDERINLSLSPKLEHLFDQGRFDAIQNAVRAITNAELGMTLEVDDSDRETPAECLSRLGYEHEEQVRDSMRNDPAVQSIMHEFSATIKENSIKPISH